MRRRAGRRSCARSASRRRRRPGPRAGRAGAAVKRSRSTPQLTTSVLPRASGTDCSSRARSQSETAITVAAPRTTRRMNGRTNGYSVALATSWPCAVTTSGAPTARAATVPEAGREKEVRVDDIGTEAAGGPDRAQREPQVAELAAAAAVEHDSLDHVARVRRARAPVPGRRRRSRAPRRTDTSARRGGCAPANHLGSRRCPSLPSSVAELNKTFRVPEREAGLRAAVKGLFRRKHREVRAVDGDLVRDRAGRGRRLPRPERRRQDDDAEDALRACSTRRPARRACSATSPRSASATTSAGSRS